MTNSKIAALVSFLIFLLFLSLGMYFNFEVLNETRKSLLVKRMSLLQVSDIGAFRHFDYIPAGGYLTELAYVNAPITAKALASLKALNGLEYVNVNDSLDYISLKQHPQEGGFGIYYGYDGTHLGLDLGSTYFVVHNLNLINKLDTLNQTSLINFVLVRYNTSLGAFHELVTEAYNKSYALSAFGMSFTHYEHEMAYSIPNIISTFLGVSILADLDALQRINTTRTLEWVNQCKTSDGLFEPFPNASYSTLPPWSPLKTNPFDIDVKGTGTPYIYAAIGTLNAFNRLDSLSQQDKQNIKEYLISCQSNNGMFYMHSNERFDKHSRWTEYAIMSLYQIDMLSEAEENVQKTVDYIIQKQILELDNKLLFPGPQDTAYGFFSLGGSDLLGDTNIAVLILNTTKSLSTLDKPTPISFLTIRNILLLSLIAPSIIAISLIWRRFYQKIGKNNEGWNEQHAILQWCAYSLKTYAERGV